MEATLPIGARIRHYRKRHGNRPLTAVAGLCGISERYLSMIENGQRTPSSTLLVRLAAELGVPVAALLSDEPASKAAEPARGMASEVARALMGYRSGTCGAAAAPGDLRERVEAAWRIWQASAERFTEIEAVLSTLIVDVEHSVRAYRRSTDAAARRDVLRVAADLYGLLRSYCRRSGRLDLSLMAADRGRRAAEDADDPIRLAGAHWNMGQALLSQPGGAQDAAEVAGVAIDELDQVPASVEADAMRGALELVRVVAEACGRKWWVARERLAQNAAPLGARAGESNVMWTVFGPTNIGLHALSVELLAGRGADGLRRAASIDVYRLPSRERQFTFTLELARCHDLLREDAAVVVHLLLLERLSRQDMARSSLALDMVTGLLRRARPTYRRQVSDLAERLELV